MKKLIIIISSVIILFIGIILFVINFLMSDDGVLNNFEFTNVTNTGLNYYVYYNPVKDAKNYEITVYDSLSNIVYRDSIEESSATIKFDSLIHDESYEIELIANLKNGDKKKVKEPYKFKWDELTFSEENDVLITNDEDYVILFDGHYDKKDYKMNIKENGKLIDTVDIKNNTYTLKNSMFKDKQVNYNLEIIDQSLVISTLNIYNLMSPITDIKIKYPSTGDMMDYNDVAVSFEGGDNASNYLLELYNNTTNKLIRRKEIKSKNVILSSNLFEKSSSYKVKITASYYDYVDYSKSAEVDFTINPKETLMPVYTDHNFYNIKKGTKIKLMSPNENAKIYYTLDGSDPSQNGIEYTEEITINENTTVKAVAKEDKKNDSIVTTYDFKVGTKDKYKVYLSASDQPANLGVSSTGYTNEKKEMTDLTNYIEKRLNEYGVITYTHDSGGINRWTADSTYLGVDLHLAIHSNASEDHKTYGVETWVNNEDSASYSLAQMLQNNMMNIYYKKDDKLANRGVKYAKGTLGEVNPTMVPFGILIEVAHHDYESDAKWIMDNKELIGNTIADTILEYFQIK